MNESTDKMDQAMARLGGTLAPLAADLKSLGADAINFLLDRAEEAVDFFSGLPDRALTWGRDLIDSFVGGIKDKIDSLGEAVSGAAQTVADFLGFSEPERGPLSNFHTYAPDMMDLYAKGIRENTYKVTEAVDQVAGQMRRSVPTPTVETVQSAAAGMVNGLAALNQGGGFPKEIVLKLENGKEVARWLLPDIRAVSRADPEVVSGV